MRQALEKVGDLLLTKLEPLAVKAGEAAAVKIVALFFHKASSDPEFVSKNTVVMTQLANAKTDQEIDDATAALRALITGP